MVERRNMDRVQRSLGSQPVFHDSASVDALNAMVVALLGEVMVLRDRIDANERTNEQRGGHGPGDVDRYQPDDAARAARASQRDACLDRVLGAARERLMPDALRQEQQAYDQLMDTISQT